MEDHGGRAWERQAETWARRVRAGEDFYRDAFNRPAFLDFLPDLAGRAGLDLGCGEGGMTRDLAARGARMTGVDRAEAMIALARAREDGAPQGIRYSVGDLQRLDEFADGAFDFAISTMALMNCPDLPAAFAATARVLKPGGGFYFSVLHPCFVTPGIDWIASDTGGRPALTVAGYFDEAPVMERLTFDKAGNEDSAIEVPRFPHRLECYVNALVRAGFAIRKVAEPRPRAAAVEAHPRLERWRRDAALFLHVAAERTGCGTG